MASTNDSSSSKISNASTPELFAGVINDAKELAIGHLGRMRGEISDEFSNLKAFLAKIAIMVGVVVVGSILLGHTIALVFVEIGLPAWAGYLVTTVLAFGGGAFLLKRLPGDKTNMDLIPESALEDFSKDMRDIRKGNSGRRHEPAHATHH